MEKFNLEVNRDRCPLIDKDVAMFSMEGTYLKSLEKKEMSTLSGQEEFPFHPRINYRGMAICQ